MAIDTCHFRYGTHLQIECAFSSPPMLDYRAQRTISYHQAWAFNPMTEYPSLTITSHHSHHEPGSTLWTDRSFHCRRSASSSLEIRNKKPLRDVPLTSRQTSIITGCPYIVFQSWETSNGWSNDGLWWLIMVNGGWCPNFIAFVWPLPLFWIGTYSIRLQCTIIMHQNHMASSDQQTVFCIHYCD